jgi:hypothetical protein
MQREVMGCASGRAFEPYKAMEQERELGPTRVNSDLDEDKELVGWVFVDAEMNKVM